MNKYLAFVCTLGLTVFISGCTTYTGDFVSKTEKELEQMESKANSAKFHFQNENYKEADNILSNLVAEKTVSQPLYELDRVPVLLLSGNKEEAHELLMDVRNNIETLFDPDLEERATSIWHGEVNKVYKGDAHERSTMYALLALSFIDRGEYEDAYRSVKNGMLADRFGSEEIYNADYALIHYLGWICSLRSNDTDVARRHYEAMLKSLETQKVSTNSISTLKTEIARNPNTLIVLWSGFPPNYSKGGKYGEKRMVLAGEESQFDFVTIENILGEEQVLPMGLGNINYQATTRGGRLMDNVLKDKAEVKDTFHSVAKTSLVLSSFCFGLGNACLEISTASNTPKGNGKDPLSVIALPSAIVGLCCYGAGICCFFVDLAFMWAYNSVDATADIRSWKTLPGQLNVLPLRLPTGHNYLKFRGYIAGDIMQEKIIEVDISDDDGISVVHVPCMGDGALANAITLYNSSMPNENERPIYPTFTNETADENVYDKSTVYSIIGTDVSSRFKMKSASMTDSIFNAMLKYGYNKHYISHFATAGLYNKYQPDIVIGAKEWRCWINNVNGQNVLDTRVIVMVRQPIVYKKGDNISNQGDTKYFYGWSRMPVSASVTVNNLTEETKSIAITNAIDNLFQNKDFRLAISKLKVPEAKQIELSSNPKQKTEQDKTDPIKNAGDIDETKYDNTDEIPQKPLVEKEINTTTKSVEENNTIDIDNIDQNEILHSLTPSFPMPEIKDVVEPFSREKLIGKWSSIGVTDSKVLFPSGHHDDTIATITNKVILTLNEDGTYNMLSSLGGKDVTTNGTWEYQNDNLRIFNQCDGKTTIVNSQVLWYSESEFEFRFATLSEYEENMRHLANVQSVKSFYDKFGIFHSLICFKDFASISVSSPQLYSRVVAQ